MMDVRGIPFLGPIGFDAEARRRLIEGAETPDLRDRVEAFFRHMDAGLLDAEAA